MIKPNTGFLLYDLEFLYFKAVAQPVMKKVFSGIVYMNFNNIFVTKYQTGSLELDRLNQIP